MTDFDLERLGDVWRQQPAPAEMERLRRTATAVARRARFSNVIDIVAAVAVAAVVISLVISNPRAQTFAMGAAAILVLLGSNVRLRRLRKIELRGLAGPTESMLDQSIERIETTVRHNRFSLLAMAPALLFGILLAAIVIPRPANRIGQLDVGPLTVIIWDAGWIALVAALAIFVARSLKRGRRELDRLQSMREAYRQEEDSR